MQQSTTPSPSSNTNAQPTTKIPLMKWSQTLTTLSLVVSIRDPTSASTPQVTITPTHLQFSIRVDTTSYQVDAPLFASVVPESCSWRVLGNGELMIVLKKRVEQEDLPTTEESSTPETTPPTYTYATEWDHPFLNRAYKGFVRIDWTRWTDVDATANAGASAGENEYGQSYENSVSDEDSEEDHEYPPLGPITEADTSDLPNESNPDFQEMMDNLTKLAQDSDTPLPSMDELAQSGGDIEAMKTMLASLTSQDMTGMEGVSGVDLDKVGVDEEEVVAKEEDKESVSEATEVVTAEEAECPEKCSDEPGGTVVESSGIE